MILVVKVVKNRQRVVLHLKCLHDDLVRVDRHAMIDEKKRSKTWVRNIGKRLLT